MEAINSAANTSPTLRCFLENVTDASNYNSHWNMLILCSYNFKRPEGKENTIWLKVVWFLTSRKATLTKLSVPNL